MSAFRTYNKNGLTARQCKDCTYDKKRKKYLDGDIRCMIHSMWYRINKRLRYDKETPCGKRYKDVQLKITYQEFIDWSLKQQHLPSLIEGWVKSGNKTPLIPCIDRIDGDGHYEFGNIRIMTMRENSYEARLKYLERYRGKFYERKLLQGHNARVLAKLEESPNRPLSEVLEESIEESLTTLERKSFNREEELTKWTGKPLLSAESKKLVLHTDTNSKEI